MFVGVAQPFYKPRKPRKMECNLESKPRKPVRQDRSPMCFSPERDAN